MKRTSNFCEIIFTKSSHALVKLRMKLGPAGPGIYMCILEALYDEPTATLPRDYETIAYRFGLSTKEVRTVVEDFDLFKFSDDGNEFYCELLRQKRLPKPKHQQTAQAETSVTSSTETPPSAETNEEVIFLPQVYPDPTVQSLPPLRYDQKVALELQRFMSLPIKERIDLLRNDADWIKNTARDYGVNQQAMLKFIDKYEKCCIDDDEIHYNCADLKYRFIGWCTEYTNNLSDCS